MWPTSEAGCLKFIIDIYFDDTISDEDKYLIVSKKGNIYLKFYNYLKLSGKKKKKNEIENSITRILKI